MRHFGQRVVLIHELGQLAGTEKFLDRCGYRLGVDDVLRHQAFRLHHTQTFTHSTFNTHEPYSEDVFRHLTNTSDTTITQVIDIIDRAVTVTDINQNLHDRFDIFLVQRTRPFGILSHQPTIELHTPDRRQVVAICFKEQIVEQILRRFLGRWLTGAHHSVNFYLCLELSFGRIDSQCIGDIGTTIQIVDIEHFNLFDATLMDLFD